MSYPTRDVLQPFRAGLREMWRQSALAVLAAVLATFGVLSLIAAAFVSLIPVIGVAGALALNGLALMVLAVGTLGLIRLRRRPNPEPRQQAAVDPMVQLVFDLSFDLGNRLARRRK